MQVSLELSKFHITVKQLVRVACENALKREGFVPDPIENEQNNSSSKLIV